MLKLPIALLLCTVLLYKVTLTYGQSTVNTVEISSESVHCLTSEQRIDTLKWLRENISSILNEQHVEISTIVPECGDDLWYRVAYLNMTDPSQRCPSEWREYNTSGVRACGRPVSDNATGSCPSTFHGRFVGESLASKLEVPMVLIPHGQDSLWMVYLSVMEHLSTTSGAT